jgi:8-oxo-dGTP pyrophosphatase MutT (NUDIX family)
MLDLVPSGDPRLAASDDLAVARSTIAAVDLDDAAVAAYRGRMLAFVDEHPDALHRTCTAGHLTGSAWVVDPSSDRILLLFHAKVRRWLQPGGHADGDANLAAVALREAVEETGIEGLSVHPVPIDLDVHRFVSARTDEPDHDHLDVRFLVVTPPGAEPTINHESEGARWVTPDELAGLDVDAGVHRMAAEGFAVLARHAE